MKTILFDLDGTLTDPKEGIVRCYQYAIEKSNGPWMGEAELIPHIGPPIRDCFSKILNTDDCFAIDRAVDYYRERYTDIGMFENRVYNGISNVLDGLRNMGHRLFVATSKPRIYACKILDYFQLSHYFINVYGSKLDGTFASKELLISHIFAAEKLNGDTTWMVGDRKYDMRAAVANRVLPIGVLWGYGSFNELRSAGAVYICSRSNHLLALTAQAAACKTLS